MGWKENYYKLTFKNIPNIFRIFGFIIYTKNAPITIFRYRAGNDMDFEALESNQIYLSNMCIQDDGFEGKYEIKFKKHLNNDTLKKIMQNMVDDFIEYVRSHFYIACFAESRKNEKMWEQYADNSKGFCIEYNLQACKEYIFPVIYKMEKSIYFESLNEWEARKFLLIKHSKWDWQDEWRIVWPFYSKPHDGEYIEQPPIEAIYKGRNMSSDKIKKLEKYCDEHMIPLF